jgi:sulfopyruvate decarboxylase TPP-binding subunit
MFTGPEIAATLEALGYTHVVWLPDSTIGTWEAALTNSTSLRLVRVCREGEAWPLAAGLHLGGAQPIVIMQCTGLYESGDALRNVLFDLQVPLTAIVGVRSWLLPNSSDSAKQFARPLLDAWGVDYRLIENQSEKPTLREHLSRSLAAKAPGIVLMAEGKG